MISLHSGHRGRYAGFSSVSFKYSQTNCMEAEVWKNYDFSGRNLEVVGMQNFLECFQNNWKLIKVSGRIYGAISGFLETDKIRRSLSVSNEH